MSTINAPNAIHGQRIDHPSAWTNRSLGGPSAITYRLNEIHLNAFNELLDKTKHLPMQSIGRREFDHPAVNLFLRQARAEIMHGRGIVLVDGLYRGRYSEDECERIFWGCGTHLGVAAVQSARGDRMGHVRHEQSNPKDRGYISNRELKLHSDAYEVVGLMCVQAAESGGESRIASALAVHNEILRDRPDLLAPLYQGFQYATVEAASSRTPITPMAIPVFSCVDGHVSCMYMRAYMRMAAERLGTTLPAGLTEALQYFETIAERDHLLLRLGLEPGEMLLFNNFTTVHARSAFTNSPSNERHLLRLWLRVPNGRPVAPALHERGRTYEQIYRDSVSNDKQFPTPAEPWTSPAGPPTAILSD